MAKVKEFGAGYILFCPGCRTGHYFPVRPNKRDGVPGPKWRFEGTVDEPTFMPSMNITSARHRCHSFVEKGKIRFLGDCAHDLKGQTVELPDTNNW